MLISSDALTIDFVLNLIIILTSFSMINHGLNGSFHPLWWGVFNETLSQSLEKYEMNVTKIKYWNQRE